MKKSFLETLTPISPPSTSPDYMLNLIIGRHLVNLAWEISKDHPELVSTFKEYLNGKSFEHLTEWEQQKEKIAYSFNELTKEKKEE